jgi:signal transduction histidine kinase/Flp pilus assembly protein TadD
MDFHYFKGFFLAFFWLGFFPASAQVEDLKKVFDTQKGENQINTGLIICDSLEENPSGLLSFAIDLLGIAEKAVPKSMLLARVHIAVSDGYYYSDSIGKSNEHLIKAISLAEAAKPVDSLFLANCYNDLGMNYGDGEEFERAIDNLTQAIRILRNSNSLNDLANALSNLAAVHNAKGQFQEAITLYGEVYQIDIKTGNVKGQSTSLNNLGRMNVEWGKYQSGLEYYQKSIQLLDTIAQRDVLAIRYNNIGMVYQLMEKHSDAIRFFNKAMKIDSEEGNVPKISIRHFNLGNSYLALNDFKNARASFEQAESFFIQTKMYSRLSKIYLSLGQLSLKQGNKEIAEDYLLKSRDMAEKAETLPEKFQSYAKLYQFYKANGSFDKALLFHELQTEAEDSIYNLKASGKIEELEAQYQNEKKEAEISRLESDNELKKKELSFRKKERNWAFAGITVLIVFLGGLYSLFATVKRQKSTLQLQNQELDRLNQTQTRLFGIISHDLRNVAAAYLASAKIIEYNLNKGQPEKLMPVAAEISRNAKNLSAMLESLLHWAVIQIKGIEPDKKLIRVREEFDLATALVKDAAEQKDNTIVINAKDETVWCDPESFRLITRNLIGNALKFTSKGTITIGASCENGFTTIKFRDTGCGIAPDTIENLFVIGKGKVKQGTAGEKGTGLGLLMVAEHVETNGGTIRVESEENTGTTFYISLPSN